MSTKKKTKSSKPSTKQLKDYLHHYHYEVGMLSASYQAHNMYSAAKIIEPQSSIIQVLVNATLESFLIHSRCLIEFFHADDWKCKYKAKGGFFDLASVERHYVAQHYVPTWASIRRGIQLRTNISVDRFDEISKQMSHFSRDRKSQHKWPHFEIYPDLIQLHEHFEKNLPQHFLSKAQRLKLSSG